MRTDKILDLKYMAIRTIENELSLDEHMALYSKLIKFTDSPILRRADDRFLCNTETNVIINGYGFRILDINLTTYTINIVRIVDRVLFDYHVGDLKLIGFTLDNEPILEYNV